ncbi:hypothetical protein Tco_0843110 [Tanacetum coccineum]|uniref:Uncharacterized protein n=1 Tax=Tanacetum coccineum TaxID=301880 RepID=A0ABQ5B2D8_9ASTR
MDDDLLTYEVEVANIPCDSKMDNDSEQEADDDMGYDPSDVAFIEWLGSKNFNYKTMDHYTMKELWIYWIREDDEVVLTDEDLLIMMMKLLKSLGSKLIYLTTRHLSIQHLMNLTTFSSWKDDVYCNRGNLLGAYIIGNQLHYQDYEWYEALGDCKLKDEALRNKAIMKGSIKEEYDESRYEQKRQWNTYTNYDNAYEMNHEHNKSEELCEIQEQPVCNIGRYMMIKYSFNDDDEYVAVKEGEYDDLTVTRKEACPAYQEIFQIMDEGWMIRRNQGDDLMPTIEEGEVIEEFRTRDEDLDIGIDDYPSYCDDDKKIHIDCAHNLKDNVIGALMNVPIFVGTFSVMTDFAVLEDMDAYRDEGMDDIIVGEPFLKEIRIKSKCFEGIITLYNGDDEVTYQMVRSHPRFKNHTNERCNKIPPLLKISEKDVKNGISHAYQNVRFKKSVDYVVLLYLVISLYFVKNNVACNKVYYAKSKK